MHLNGTSMQPTSPPAAHVTTFRVQRSTSRLPEATTAKRAASKWLRHESWPELVRIIWKTFGRPSIASSHTVLDNKQKPIEPWPKNSPTDDTALRPTTKTNCKQCGHELLEGRSHGSQIDNSSDMQVGMSLFPNATLNNTCWPTTSNWPHRSFVCFLSSIS